MTSTSSGTTRAQIDQLKKYTGDAHALLLKNIDWLTDMKNVYLSCPTTAKKQELIRTVFGPMTCETGHWSAHR